MMRARQVSLTTWIAVSLVTSRYQQHFYHGLQDKELQVKLVISQERVYDVYNVHHHTFSTASCRGGYT